MCQTVLDVPAELADTLRKAERLTVLTGAGISAESGVPTFREAQTGLWARFRPEQLATQAAYKRDPRLVWEWYTWRRELTARAQPNLGHYALVEIEHHISNFILITQNVDGLHQRAGSRNVVELHGNIQRNQCMEEGIPVDSWADCGEIPPRCPSCGGLLRPGVVWFGENLPEDALQTAWIAAETADMFLSIGTSTLVEPAASLSFNALQHGATVVEVNPNETPLTHLAAYSLKGPSGLLLPKLVQATWGQSSSK
jgi:NAD-dependent deacetylase